MRNFVHKTIRISYANQENIGESLFASMIQNRTFS